MDFIVTTDLTSTTYEDALAIRKTVFVAEQHVPLDLEIEHEEATIHFVAYVNGVPLATARLMPEGTDFRVQRMAVLKPYRHHGVGAALLNHLAKYARRHGAAELRLNAQTQAVGFYKMLNYQPADQPAFMEAGIPHQAMVLKLRKRAKKQPK